MLINRYFSRELINCLFAVTFIVLVIFLGNQLIRYLNDAASGNMALAVVGKLLLLEVPYLLALLLPITFFIALLLILGRVSADHELIILQACGFSPWQHWKMIARPCFFVVAIITLLVFWVQPKISSYRNQLLATTNAGASIETLMPGKFQVGAGGHYVFYVEKSSVDHKHLHNIFVAEKRQNPPDDPQWDIIKAANGELVEDLKSQTQFIQISNGNRYVGDAGTSNFQHMIFDQYLILTRSPPISPLNNQTDALTNLQLLSLIRLGKPNDAPGSLPRLAAAQFEWRLSMPIACILLAILASRFGIVPPRQGRYARLLPSILFLIIYINLLLVARGWVSDAVIHRLPGIFFIHFIFALILISILFPWKNFWHRYQAKEVL